MNLLNPHLLFSLSMFLAPILIAGGIYFITKFTQKKDFFVSYDEF
ncbi:hypothetical protein [Clostridium perfringens]|nr:hypothetical protein [Clostridium perfringens]